MHVAQIAERRLARVRGRARAASERRLSPQVRTYFAAAPAARLAQHCLVAADGRPERRRSSRIITNSKVLMRRIGRPNCNASLKDISTGGCLVEMADPGVLGDPVIARFPQLEPLGSRVCWAEGATTGVQFLRTIHPAVLDMLLIRLSNQEAA